MKYFLMFMFFLSSIVFADTYEEPCFSCRNKCCLVDDKDILELKDDLHNKSIKIDKNSDKIGTLEKGLAVHIEQYASLEKSSEKLSDTVWSYFEWVTELFMWVLGGGLALSGLHIWREHSSVKKRLEIEELEIKIQKQDIQKERDVAKELVRKANVEIAQSLESMKKRMVIEFQLLSKNIDEDELYVAIRQLSQFPSLENYSLLTRLSDSSLLTSDFDTELVSIIEKLKVELKSSHKRAKPRN